MPSKLVSMLFSLLGAAAGAVLGYFAYLWFLHHGFYALILPGACLGFGCGMQSVRRSLWRGILCGIGALAVGLWCEWKEFPMVADKSFTYFLLHVHQLNAVTLLMVSLGSLLAFWWGRDDLGSFWIRRWGKPRTHGGVPGSGSA